MTNAPTPIDHTVGHLGRSLQRSAYVLRQYAINGGGDLEGWRLARRMRDAETLHQFSSVESELGRYLKRNALDLSKVA